MFNYNPILKYKDEKTRDTNKMRSIHELYGKVLAKEFSILKRDSIFVGRLSEILSRLARIALIERREVRAIQALSIALLSKK
jgi:hypothetical protein